MLVDAARGLERRLDEDRVTKPVEPGAIRAQLAQRYDFQRERPLAEIVSDIFEILYDGMVHPNHRRHFGLFVPGVRPSSVVADALAALLNPQVGSWWYAPGASELESFVLDAFAAKIGFDEGEQFSHFTTGGAEANMTAVVLALTRAFPECRVAGLAVSKRRPVLYASRRGHDSFTKIAHMVGIGRDAVRHIRTDCSDRLDLDDLRRQYTSDVRSGAQPFFVVGTAGTTASGAFDPLSGVAAFKRETGLWFHVDAGWGGLALLVEELRPLVSGIENSDSVTWDAHKILPVPMGAGMFFARTGVGLSKAFGVEPAYVPSARPGTLDLYQHSMQWSRRFIGLKVFLTLAELGWQGIESILRHQQQMGQLLRDELIREGFSLANSSPLPLVCFSHPAVLSGRRTADDVVMTLLARGRVWVSSVRLSPDQPKAIRACITNHRTSADDVKCLVSELANALSPETIDSAAQTRNEPAGPSTTGVRPAAKPPDAGIGRKRAPGK
jgi:glutamate/tyrosine decarboxylase-like PLP-dependent enzyme